MATQPKQTSGRSGGRAGGAGYDYQDVYVAWQLAKMLLGEADPIVEVLWEKKTIDSGDGVEPVHVDDAITRRQSGEWIYTQLKEQTSSGWTARNLSQSGVLGQFWQQWQARPPESRQKTHLQLASSSNLDALALVNDAALRSRTPAELMSEETSSATIEYVKKLAEELSLSETNPALHEFMKQVGVMQLPAAHIVEGWVANELAIFGEAKSNAVNHLIRIVARSKHVGPNARSSLTRDGLIEQLRTDGFDLNVLVDNLLPNLEARVDQVAKTLLLLPISQQPRCHVSFPAIEDDIRRLLIDERKNVLVNGLPGGGKTTLLRHIAESHGGFYLDLRDVEAKHWWERGDDADEGDFFELLDSLAAHRERVVLCLDALERAKEVRPTAERIVQKALSFPANVRVVLGVRQTAIADRVLEDLQAGLSAETVSLPVLVGEEQPRFLTAYEIPSELPNTIRRALSTPLMVKLFADATSDGATFSNAAAALSAKFENSIDTSDQRAFLHAYSAALVDTDSYAPIPSPVIAKFGTKDLLTLQE